MNNIINATFVSYWDGGLRIASDCKVNLETKEVFDIVAVDVNVDALEGQYVQIGDTEYRVAQEGDFGFEDAEYWYE